jgi:putative flippase GtrA
MKRLIKFWLTGITGTCVDMVVLFVLSRYVFKTDFLIYYIAPIISFELAMFNNYNVSRYWVWKDRHKHGTYFIQLYKYNIACLAAFGVKMVFLILAKQLFSWDVLLCNLIGLCFSFVVNYIAGEKLIFRHEPEE